MCAGEGVANRVGADQYSGSAQSNDGLAGGECGKMWQASPLLVALAATSALLLVPIAKPFAQAA